LDGFSKVKKTLVFVFYVLIAATASAQAKDAPRLNFQDSVRLVLENTRNVDAMAVGAAFSTIFNSLGQDQQITIIKQARLMKKQGYSLRPHMVLYYGAITDAVNIEKVSPDKLTEFLRVVTQSLEKLTKPKVILFLTQSRTFFQFHALHADRSFRLKCANDLYRFVFAEPAAPPPPDTTKTEEEDPWKEYDDAAADSVLPPPPPFWKTPIVLPTLLGPVIEFERTDLWFVTRYDSTPIQGTQGTYSLTEKVFAADGGRFDWRSAGLGPDSVFAQLNKFSFEIAKPEFKAEQVQLTYIGRLAERVEGILEFRSTAPTGRNKSYPRFISYEGQLAVLGLGGNELEYRGGFALSGPHVYSACLNGDLAFLQVTDSLGKRFYALGKQFDFQDSVISSAAAAVTIYHDNDSIYHPAVQLRYHTGSRLLSLHRSKGLFKDVGYASTFYNVDFSGDILKWHLKSDSLNIFTTTGVSQEPMIIESIDHYDPNDYLVLRGGNLSFHPVGLVARFVRETGRNEFYPDDLAIQYQLNPNQTRMGMELLASKGMVKYDPQTRKVTAKDQLLRFHDANKGTIDFDNLKIQSYSERTANASMNLAKRYFTIRGVEEFKVSDSLNVIIKPDSSVITLLKDRDLRFNGKITAGNFEIMGKDFTLKYDSFFISLNHIDSIRFYVNEVNAKGQMVRRRVNNAMVGADSTAAAAGGLAMSEGAKKTSGTLFINRPDNKSGKLRLPNYPRLDASAGGVIYFDRQEVLDGAYDRSVFFVVPPFKLDSLSDADPGAINFEGTFVSSNMFPSFKEKLHTMPDKSLGFMHDVPAKGYPLYGSEGKLFGSMQLDNNGIRSTGKIDYLAATVESRDFVFYPDSVVGRGTVGEVKEKQVGGAQFPQVTLTEYKLRWLPKLDRFTLKNLREPFSLYNRTAEFEGDLTVSKKGTAGDGKLVTRGTEATSAQFTFASKEFGARHADFKVNSNDPQKPALAGKDVRLNFNLEKSYADISPEIEGEAAIEFPYAQFKTSITDARWDLTTQKISMTKDADVPLENSYFYTTRKDLDSLVFNAERAEYDFKSQQLKVSGIPYIVVADAKITPDKNEILILEDSKIGQLTNTTIVMDTLNGFHRLTEGVVTIVSRKEFSGYATYQFVNAVNDTFAIKMTDFHLENIAEPTKTRRFGKTPVALQQTVANGAVTEQDKISISPRIFYKGDMVMYATKPALQLNGFVKMDLKKIPNYNTWIKHSQSGDEKDFFLNFDQAVTEEGRRAEAGLHFGEDNNLYITFVFEKKNPEDEDFFLPSGSLFFDKETNEFKIEDRQKAAGEKLSGKVFAYNEEKQEVKFEGPISFFRGSKDFNITATSLGSGNLETNEIKLNSFLMVDVATPAGALDMLAAQIAEVIKNESVPEGLGDPTELLYKIADIAGERAAKDYEQKSLQGSVPLVQVPGMIKPMVFADVNFKWSQKFKAFYSVGNLGLSNLGRTDVNGAYEGFIELRRTEDGSPVFHLFLKASPEVWCYFGMEDNRLMVHSSLQNLNDLIAKKSNAAKAKAGELVTIPGSEDETLAFVNRFRKDYLGIETLYDLAGNSAAKKKEKKDTKVEDDGF
jgi:hypothetical protein